MKKIYYQLEMYQKSPLRVGSGASEVTDSDLMIDERGCPFIPGSSVAGVLRELYEKKLTINQEKAADTLFGYVNGEDIASSHVIVSDAVGPKGASASDYFVSVRDGIRLDEWGITVPGNKYDFQVVETTLPYYSVLEWTGEEDLWKQEITDGLEPLMKRISGEGIAFGARTTRGYGNMSVTVRRKVFDFPDDLTEWLLFDPFQKEAFQGTEIIEAEKEAEAVVRIQLSLRIKVGFSVRVSTARAEMLQDGSIPDAMPLCNADGKPVIPGTSWAGVFRHHMLSLLRQTGIDREDGRQEAEINRLFGMEEKEGEHRRSAIRFTETVIDGGVPCSVMRNAIDRFTQAPKNMALFTDRLWYGGKGELEITIENGRITPLQARLLAVSLIDLDLGLLTFGGAAGTGHGLCEITDILVNGREATASLKRQECHFLEEAL